MNAHSDRFCPRFTLVLCCSCSYGAILLFFPNSIGVKVHLFLGGGWGRRTHYFCPGHYQNETMSNFSWAAKRPKINNNLKIHSSNHQRYADVTHGGDDSSRVGQQRAFYNDVIFYKKIYVNKITSSSSPYPRRTKSIKNVQGASMPNYTYKNGDRSNFQNIEAKCKLKYMFLLN